MRVFILQRGRCCILFEKFQLWSRCISGKSKMQLDNWSHIKWRAHRFALCWLFWIRRRRKVLYQSNCMHELWFWMKVTPKSNIWVFINLKRVNSDVPMIMLQFTMAVIKMPSSSDDIVGFWDHRRLFHHNDHFLSNFIPIRVSKVKVFSQTLEQPVLVLLV